MSARWSTLCIGFAASLALLGTGVAQTRLAITSPTVNPDPLDSPVTPSPAPPAGSATQPVFVVAPDPRAGDVRSPPTVATEPRGNPLWAIPVKSLSFTRDRPLFTPSRRPPAPSVAYIETPRPVVAPKPAEPERPQLALIGMVLGEKDGVAIFVDETTREVIRLRKNEGYGGWILRSLQGREATLEKAGFTAMLVISPPGGDQASGVLISGQRPTLRPGEEPQL